MRHCLLYTMVYSILYAPLGLFEGRDITLAFVFRGCQHIKLAASFCIGLRGVKIKSIPFVLFQNARPRHVVASSVSSLFLLCFFSALCLLFLSTCCRVVAVFGSSFTSSFCVLSSSFFRVVFESFSRLTADCVYAISGSGGLR